MGVRTANVKDGNIGETLEGLAAVIHQRAVSASPEESYTARLLQPEKGDKLLSKLAEESSEIIMACKAAKLLLVQIRLAHSACRLPRSTASRSTNWPESLTPVASRKHGAATRAQVAAPLP